MTLSITTPWNFDNHGVNSHQVLFVSLAGSRLYGYHRANSDYDYRGIYLNTPDEILGPFAGKDSIESMVTDDSGNTSDVVLYELRKFIRLAVAGNPNILEILFSPQDAWEYSRNLWCIVYNERHAFLSKQLYKPYSEFMASELKKLNTHYDPKAAANCYRLMVQCITLCREGTFSPRLNADNAQMMKDIRNEQLDPLYVLSELQGAHLYAMPLAYEKTILPDTYDKPLVTELCTYVYRGFLK